MIGQRKRDALGAPIKDRVHYRAWTSFSATRYLVIQRGTVLPGSDPQVQANPRRWAPIDADPLEVARATWVSPYSDPPTPRRKRPESGELVECVRPLEYRRGDRLERIEKGERLDKWNDLVVAYPKFFRAVR